MIRVIGAGAVLLGLAGCSPQACDPSQAGFFSGIGCEASGNYRVRNLNQQSTLARENAQVLQNQVSAREASDQADRAVVTRDEARRRLSGADRQTVQIRARLAAARNGRMADQGRLAQAQAELTGLQRDRTALQNGASADQLRAFEDRQRRLNDSIGNL